MLREFTLKDAFIYAFFFHVLLLAFLGTQPLKQINKKFFTLKKPFIFITPPNKQPLSFKFVDVPQTVPKQEPLHKDTDGSIYYLESEAPNEDDDLLSSVVDNVMGTQNGSENVNALKDNV